MGEYATQHPSTLPARVMVLGVQDARYLVLTWNCEALRKCLDNFLSAPPLNHSQPNLTNHPFARLETHLRSFGSGATGACRYATNMS